MAKYTLHYGGTTFQTNDGSVLDDLAGDKKIGSIQFRLDDDRWLTILTGPGIPVALEENVEPQLPSRVR